MYTLSQVVNRNKNWLNTLSYVIKEGKLVGYYLLTQSSANPFVAMGMGRPDLMVGEGGNTGTGKV